MAHRMYEATPRVRDEGGPHHQHPPSRQHSHREGEHDGRSSAQQHHHQHQHQHQNQHQHQQHRRQRSDASTSSRAPRQTIASSTALGLDAPRQTIASSTALGHEAQLPRPQPAVYWSDGASRGHSTTSTAGPGTFFDESTPPPSPSYPTNYTRDLSTAYTSDVGTATKDTPPYDYRYDHVAPPAPLPKRGVFGLSKKVLWAVAGVVTLLVIGLAVGLGVGLTVGDDDGEGGSADGQEGAPTSTTMSLTSPTATFSSPPDPTGTNPIETSSACPAANNTLFSVPGSDRTFRRLCGVDYLDEGGTTDLGIVWTASIQDCIINCAGFENCTACSWGVIPGDTYKDNHRCFLKTDLGRSSEARDGWDFAIEIDG